MTYTLTGGALKRARIPEAEIEAMRQRFRRAGIANVEAQVEAATGDVWMNGTYQVVVRPEPAAPDWPPMLRLSIKRRDRGAIFDWRDMQAIKNQLVGPDCEAVQLFPAEDRLVDTANQYWLYALSVPGVRFPFGFGCRSVASPAEAEAFGARQRATS